MNRSPLSPFLISGLIVAFLVSGCKIIDQRTFDPNAGRPPRIPESEPAPAPPAVPPLMVIQAGTPQEQWKEPVKNIVHEALARKRSVLFMVHCLVPQSNALNTEQSAMLNLVQGEGLAIMQSIIAAGVPEAQVEMSTMTKSTLKKPVIEVYVR
ncbi:MAG: hypothetical protein IJ934_07595 [Acetobacter sp.]|nr:hypothetical protein [Acetobacter sp.]